MNSCPEQERIQEYLDGELAGEQAGIIARHLSSCPQCQRLYQELKAISDSLAQQPRPGAPAQLKQKVLQAVSQAESVPAISCKVAQQLISPYLDAELTPLEQQRVAAHIYTCPDCYQMLSQTQQIVAAMSVAAPVTVPAGLDERVHSAVRQAAAKEPQVIGYVGRRISWRTAGAVLAGAAAAAVIVFGLILAPHELPLSPLTAPTIVAVQPMMPPVEQPGVETVPTEVADSAEMAKQPAAGREIAPERQPIMARKHRPRPPHHVVATRSTASGAESAVPAVPAEAEVATVARAGREATLAPGSEREGTGTTPVMAESPTAADLAGVDKPKPGPRIVLVRADTREYVGPPGPGLAALPAAADEPTWTPVRAKLATTVYRGAGQVDAKRLIAASQRLNQEIAELKNNQPRGWPVVK